ncbi:unnamed protein product [Adineta ricciae]|uniref:Uncharacterized protein n=1 Tax=Adineta ricciae TaxID=249248 RepID=A0A815DLL6_ADIRI|nr:unnamed protein product [Adineta ricciae]
MFFTATSAQTTLTPTSLSSPCPDSLILCGNTICYTPTTQICTDTNQIIQCIRVCGNQCYSPPYQACVNNVTMCNIPNNSPYYGYGYQASLAQSCNGTCYDSTSQKCNNSIIQCISNCGSKCYNPSAQQCFNGTLCSVQQSICTVKYDSWGMVYNPSSLQCYDPSNQVCINSSLCSYPSRVCNGQCLLDTHCASTMPLHVPLRIIPCTIRTGTVRLQPNRVTEPATIRRHRHVRAAVSRVLITASRNVTMHLCKDASMEHCALFRKILVP